MIPVTPAIEPDSFDAQVRQPGLNWLKARGLASATIAPKGLKIEPYWTRCLTELHLAYSSICAYASLRIELVTGSRSVDHFAPKSCALDQAYEWTNYRLACSKLNSRKNNFTNVIDPFKMSPNTFQLNILNGQISPAPNLSSTELTLAQETINRLKLDDAEFRNCRTEIIDWYLAGDISHRQLLRQSPFIHGELQRQGKLAPP